MNYEIHYWTFRMSVSTKYTFQIFVDKMTMAKSEETPSTYDKVFRSLFSVQGDRSNEKYKVAQDKLGLGVLVDFRTIEENCEQSSAARGTCSQATSCCLSRQDCSLW